MKLFIVWYTNDGYEDYTIISSASKQEAEEIFLKHHSTPFSEIREVDANDDGYLAYI